LVARRPGLVRFRRRDYLGDASVPLHRAVLDVVEDRTGARPEGPIRLLTQVRSLGHCAASPSSGSAIRFGQVTW